MNYLYLVGNGFDLAHGLKTSYSDFMLNHLQNGLTAASHWGFNRGTDSLVKIEKVHSNPPTNVEGFWSLKELLETAKKHHYRITYQGCFEEFLMPFIDASETPWCDIELRYFFLLHAIYREAEKNNNGGIVYELTEELKNRLIILHETFENIKIALIAYLSEQCNNTNNHIVIDNIVSKERVVYADPDFIPFDFKKSSKALVLNFNYTSTIANYIPELEKEIESDMISTETKGLKYSLINIHGSLSGDDSEIIFGYAAHNENTFMKMLKSPTGVFSRHFKQNKYNNITEIANFLDNDKFEVEILGHSCGMSDNYLLSQIFNHENCVKIRVCYHRKPNGTNDFNDKVKAVESHIDNLSFNVRKKIAQIKDCQSLDDRLFSNIHSKQLN